MEIFLFRIFFVIFFMLSCKKYFVVTASAERLPLVIDEVQTILNDEPQALYGKTLVEMECINRLLAYFNYACTNRVNVATERIRERCGAPLAYANRICSLDDETVNDDLRQLLLTVRDRRRPNGGSGNSGSGSNPPGFMASRGRRTGVDTSHQREPRKNVAFEVANSNGGNEDFANVYANRFVGSRG